MAERIQKNLRTLEHDMYSIYLEKASMVCEQGSMLVRAFKDFIMLECRLIDIFDQLTLLKDVRETVSTKSEFMLNFAVADVFTSLSEIISAE